MLQLTAACREFLDRAMNRAFKLTREDVARAFVGKRYPYCDLFVDVVTELGGLHILSAAPWVFFPDTIALGSESCGSSLWDLGGFFEQHQGRHYYNFAEECDTRSLAWLSDAGEVYFEPDDHQVMAPSVEVFLESTVLLAIFIQSYDQVYWGGVSLDAARIDEVRNCLDERRQTDDPLL